MASGVRRPSWWGTVETWVPAKRDRAPHSSTTMWALSVAITPSHGWITEAMPTTLAPVPPQHGRLTTGASNCSRHAASARAVHGSLP